MHESAKQYLEVWAERDEDANFAQVDF